MPETRSWIEVANGRWRLGLIAGVLALLALYLVISRMRSTREAEQASQAAKVQSVPVSAAPAKKGDLNRYITAIGTVTPFSTATIKSRVDGQIVKINFTEGQIVKAGDPIAEIDPRPYQVQLTEAQGTLAKDLATLRNARVLLTRDQELYKQNVIARQDLDNQEALVGQAAGVIKSDQGAVDNAKLQLTYAHITSPITGRVGLRLVDLGNLVHATDTQGLAVVTQLQPIAVVFSIPEDDLPRVTGALNSGATLPVDAYDRDLKNKLATGALLTTDNQIDQTTGTIKLKARFANDDSKLFPNQFVNAKLMVETKHNAILIPAAGVQRSSQSLFVYVVKPDQTVEMRNVTVGATEGGIAEIDSGVNPGELVVVDGTDKLRKGTRVSVQLAANPISPGATQ